MERHCRNAAAVAAHLDGAAGVAEVIYPGLEGHPGHELAARQMRGFGGMVSVRLAGGARAAERFLESLDVFSLAESLGGVESLACYPARMTHASIPEAERERRGIGGGLVRLSVGIEDVEDLVEDLDRALREASRV
jgi:cystathionine beta-lyase/cystathionine gamma-synthase